MAGGTWRLVALIAALTIAARSVNYMVQSTMPLLARELGFGPAAIGLLAAAMASGQLVGSSLLNVALGPEHRRLAFLGAAASMPLLLLSLSLSGADALWPLAFLSGLAFGVVMPNLINLASLRREDAERLLAVYSLSLSVSLVVGPAYESAVLAQYDYRDVFLFFLPLAVILAALSARTAVPGGGPGGGLGAAYKAALTSRGLAVAVSAITAYNVPFMALVNYLPIYAGEELGLVRSAAYSLFLPFFAASMATRLYMSIRPVRDVVRAFSASVALTLVGLALLAASRTYWLLALSVVLLGVPHGSVYTLSIISIARTTRLELRNSVNSLFSSYL
ncbi:MAG: MFS transporter, partial [Thermoproteus sp.]